MPYQLRAVPGGYQVVNTATGAVHAEHTTRAKAQRQIRLLHAVEHGYKPTGKPVRR